MAANPVARMGLPTLASLTLGFCLPIAAQAASWDREGCFDGTLSFAECIHAVEQAETFVSAARETADGRFGLLRLSYVVADFATLSDGLDPQVSLLLSTEYLIDGRVAFTDLREVGQVMAFTGFERVAPGEYTFTGTVFSDEAGCPVQITYAVQAGAYTVGIRAGETLPPAPIISERVGTSCR